MNGDVVPTKFDWGFIVSGKTEVEDFGGTITWVESENEKSTRRCHYLIKELI